jgi:capsular exopolysaccharide synthesis family protein
MDATIDLKAVLGLLQRRFWLVALVMALVLGVAGIVLLTLKPVYTATALVLVDPSKKNLMDPESQLSGSSSDSLRVDSEVELVKSETTLLSVTDQLDLVSDPEFGLSLGLKDMILAFLRLGEPTLPTGEEAVQAVIDKLRQSVGAQRKGLTYLIAVNAKSGRPEFAAALANAVADTYILQQLNAKVESIRASGRVVDGRIAEANAAVAQSEEAFDSFVEQNLDRISAATGRSDLAGVREELQKLNSSRTEAQLVADLAQQSLASRDWSKLADSVKDEAIRRLETERRKLLESLSTAAEGAKPYVDLQASLNSVEAELNTAGEGAVTALKKQVAETQARATEMRADLRKTILQGDLPSDILTSIYAMQQNSEIARSQYQTLLTRQTELSNQEYLQLPDARVVSPATPPSKPSFPTPSIILFAAAAAGLGLGIALALLVENFVGGFTSEAQAETLLRTPIVSVIPRYRTQRRGGTESLSAADALVVSPLSVYSEAIRRIRIGIDQAIRRARAGGAGGRGPGVVVMVSSAAPSEGKSTVSLSLARAYALSGQTTLLIDCDLRKPSVHRQIGLDPSNGLLDFLSNAGDDFDIKKIMTIDKGSGAQVVLGSRRSDIPTDQLIAGKTFARLITAARKNFDVVVLDTPPVGPVVDGLYLKSFADAIVFVVKWSATPQQEVRAAVTSLDEAKGSDVPLVAVLNMENTSRIAYRGRYGGYYTEE